MILAIVGSVTLEGSDEALAIIEQVLTEFSPAIVVSGGAPGIDQMAAKAAKRRNIPVQEFLPKQRRWAPNGFQERNLQIAAFCDVLIRIADKDSKTYGSGWTRDRAKEMGKLTREYVL